MSELRDPVAFELFKNAVFAIADEMALTIGRAAYSGILRDIMDYSTALADAEGNLLSQGLTLPGHLGSVPTALAAVLREYGAEMAPGDVYLMNDPFDGGMHLPDVFAFKPIFADGERLAFAATVCHQCDIGGRVPGSMASDSTEIYQEGLRIPPLKLYDKGVRNETLMQMIERNVRLPVTLFGDMRAQLAACTVAEREFHDLIADHGVDGVKRLMAELVDYSERMMRAGLRELPDGEWQFEDWIDDDGLDLETPVRLFVTVTKQGERLRADWTGSSAQVKSAINSTLSFTSAAVYTAVKSVLPNNIPNNEGMFRCVDVTAPAGTVANVVLPGACAQRGVTGFRMVDCMFGALAQAVPERVCAASDGGVTVVTVGGWRADRTPFVYVDASACAWGGRPWADGLQGNASMFANMALQAAELIEAEQPLQIEAYDLTADRAGPGEYRGGAPCRRIYRFLEEEGLLQVRSDRRRFRPYGLFGGRPGKPSSNLLTRDGAVTSVPGKASVNLRKGDVFAHEWAGGGGWGDPLRRAPAQVLRDVRNELVGLESARADYGVVIDVAAWRVDNAATARLRAELVAARGDAPLPDVMWEDPPASLAAAE